MEYNITLLMTEFVTHDVKRFIVSRPDGFSYEPGQGVELTIDQDGWRDEGRPFTPTSLRDDRVLEFTIKAYPQHHRMTEKLHTLRPGASLLMSQAFGTIRYAGPGAFIAGGAGVTPFIAVLRQLAAEDRLEGHTLIFSNKTPADVICEKEFRHYLGERCILTCTRERGPQCAQRRIDRAFLQEKVRDFGQHFYLCGPPAFVKEIKATLTALGARPDTLVFEQ